MQTEQEDFIVSYCGVSVKVTPIIKNLDMQYLVSLPTRQVIIETQQNDDEIAYWVEVTGGRTRLAQEIGELIEKRDM